MSGSAEGSSGESVEIKLSNAFMNKPYGGNYVANNALGDGSKTAIT